ncbi:MAG TPA: carbamoyltransferase HypF [Vicinamibacterales bacterium]|nr:carbamoyltransferase HypF [Vicinamibacterales bacterium]
MQRREITIRGIVQGVGFRPFVHALASRLSLNGFVRNTPAGVLIQIEGSPASLATFERELLAQPPPLSSIEEVRAATLPPVGDTAFRIEPSEVPLATRDRIAVSPDAGVCEACLGELEDPANRRYRHPFITCATCGPRLTIVNAAPYDRERTTMAPFTMCGRCRQEYENPRDRRFHAETIACPSCGPRLRLLDPRGGELHGDPIACAAARLRQGGIAAVKGMGGYHLACDARNAAAVAELRRRKQRDERPFAVMFDTIGTIEAVCHVDTLERRLLTGASRPIVLLRRRETPARPAMVPDASVAPGLPHIGAMLPSTPLHHLLLAAAGRPLVMTSGNRSHEPIVTRDEELLPRLGEIADVFLVHDRAISVRCDDGVVRGVEGAPLPIRRSRGDAPRPVRIPLACDEAVLAVGGHLKNTFAVAVDDAAYVSHHVGDLDDYEAREAFRRDIALYEQLLRAEPRVVAHDLHPDYESTRYAMERAAAGLEAAGVQHHHAHVASCMAEHGISGPVIGIAFDGSGFGLDGTVWGGEVLAGDLADMTRVAHLRQVALPGGEQAVREPWRMAVAHLLDAGCSVDAFAARHRQAFPVIVRMIERRLNTPLTSSAGRLFDAVAAIAGLRDTVSFEGQAAMQLEAAAGAAPGGGDDGYPVDLLDGAGTLEMDTRPLIAAAAFDAQRGRDAGMIARRFHAGLADAAARTCERLRTALGHDTVVLSGGVFLNALLTRECERRLIARGFRVLRHERVPPNDGGLSLGQAAVAAARFRRRAGSAA